MTNTIHDTLLNLHTVMERLEKSTEGKLTISREDSKWRIELFYNSGITTQLGCDDEDFDEALDGIIELLEDEEFD